VLPDVFRHPVPVRSGPEYGAATGAANKGFPGLEHIGRDSACEGRRFHRFEQVVAGQASREHPIPPGPQAQGPYHFVYLFIGFVGAHDKEPAAILSLPQAPFSRKNDPVSPGTTVQKGPVERAVVAGRVVPEDTKPPGQFVQCGINEKGFIIHNTLRPPYYP